MNIVFLGKGQWKEGKGIVLLRKVSRVICIKFNKLLVILLLEVKFFIWSLLQYIAK